MEWPRDVPDRWPQADAIYGWKAFGFLRRSYRSRRRESQHIRASYSIKTTQAGWPCLSLEWEFWATSATPVPPDGWNQELPKLTHWRSGLPVPSERLAFILEGWERLPLHPLWLGFAFNTLFYTALLWFRFVLRRFIRVRRGLCAACAYPMSASPVCSECGKAFPTSSRRIIV